MYFRLYGVYFNISMPTSEVFEVSTIKRCSLNRADLICVACHNPTLKTYRTLTCAVFHRPYKAQCRDCRLCVWSFMDSKLCFKRFAVIVLGLRLPRDVNQLLFSAINANNDCVRCHADLSLLFT